MDVTWAREEMIIQLKASTENRTCNLLLRDYPWNTQHNVDTLTDILVEDTRHRYGF